MYVIEYSGQFKKDYKLMKRRGCNIELLEEAFRHLRATGTLPPEYRPHKLSGNKMMFSHVPLSSLSKILTGWVGQPVRYLGDDTACYTLSIARRQWQSDPLKALAAQGLSFTPVHRTETHYTFR